LFYAQTKLSERDISLEDIEDTLRRATDIVNDYRGALGRRNKIVQIAIFVAGLAMLFSSVIIGYTRDDDYWWPMFLVIVYLFSVLIVITIFKYRSSYKMRMSQFLLSIFCRAENNRLYLRHGVEIRPGFLGKWIEFICVEN